MLSKIVVGSCCVESVGATANFASESGRRDASNGAATCSELIIEGPEHGPDIVATRRLGRAQVGFSKLQD